MTLLRILAATWVAATTFPASAADEDYLSSSALAPAGLVKFWQLKLPLEADQRLADAYLVDDQLYLATQDGYVFAVHAHTGAGRWMRRVTAGGFRIKRPAHAGNRVIFNTSTQLLVLDRYSGLARAETELGFPAGSAAVTDGVNIFLGGLNQRFYCFDVDSLFEIWKASTNGPINSAPAVKDGRLYVASDDSGVYACVAANKQFFWQTATTGPNTADLVADAAGVYVASRDLSLYFFDLRFGRIRWRARFSGPLYEPPVLTAGVAYQYCPDDGVVAELIGPLVLAFQMSYPGKLSSMSATTAASVVPAVFLSLALPESNRIPPAISFQAIRSLPCQPSGKSVLTVRWASSLRASLSSVCNSNARVRAPLVSPRASRNCDCRSPFSVSSWLTWSCK